MAWNDVKKEKTNDGDKKEIKFMALPEGTHQIRILDDEPFSRWTHWLPAANGGKGTTVTCPGTDCPVCAEIKSAKAAKATPKFNSRKLHAINVLDRSVADPKDGVKILDKGNGLFEQFVGLYEEIGDLRGYDVKIRVSGSGKDTSYVVIPMAQKALTTDEKKLELFDTKTIFATLSPDKIKQLMNGATYADLKDDAADDSTPFDTDEEVPDVDFTR